MGEETLHPCWNEKIGHLPLQRPLIVQEIESISGCIRLMQKNNRGCVLVLNQSSQLTGLLTERDLMYHYVGTDLSASEPVTAIMTNDVFTITPDIDVSEVLVIFGEKPFRHLPVLKDGVLLGLLSVRVIIDFLAENVSEETLNLPPELGDIPKETFGA